MDFSSDRHLSELTQGCNGMWRDQKGSTISYSIFVWAVLRRCMSRNMTQEGGGCGLSAKPGNVGNP